MNKIFDNLTKYHIVLASNSPRRRELLKQLGIDFKVRTLVGMDESYPADLCGEEIALYISRKKAAAYKDSMADDELLITADTIVHVDGEVLGKPSGAAEARAMLTKLSGRTHEVITGVTVLTRERCESFSVTSQVKFAPIGKEETDFYIDNYLPFDKAGAYGIQEWIGLVAVEELHGSFFNVMGLPVQRLYQVLKQF